MRYATLARTTSGDDGTFGTFLSDREFKCVTGELPWRENARSRSCIPAGIYTCVWRFSPHLERDCYHLDGVSVPYNPNWRTGILIHSATWAGDTDKGLRCDLKGCIAPGRSIGEAPISKQRFLEHSRDALRELEAHFGHEPFELTIV